VSRKQPPTHAESPPSASQTSHVEAERAGLEPVDAELDRLVPEWLSLPDVAAQLGRGVNQVRQLLREGELVAVERGDPRTPQVPATFLDGRRVVKGLAGTLTLLRDAGYSPHEAIRWLYTVEEALGATPIEALREGRGTHVRRQAKTLGF
jgi:hypothetical protein